jgi:ribulose-phosphate 3-epimerase
MSVNPGFGGQSFIESSYKKLHQLGRMREQAVTNFLIEVDGGVNLENIQKVTHSGADILVAGSAVFKAKNIAKRIEKLLERAQLGKGTMV